MSLRETKRSKWRLLPVLEDNGYWQMSIDHSLLDSARAGDTLPTLRFYRWTPPALTIGRFQSIEDIDLDACKRYGIDVVRRPTGGRALLHKDDFTYALVFPQGYGLPSSIEESYLYICRGIIKALLLVGLEVDIATHVGFRKKSSEACFSMPASADLSCRGLKICGSAQVRKGGALLQHGSIMLRDNHELLFKLFRYPSEKIKEEREREYRRRCTNLEREGLNLSWRELANAFISGFEETFWVKMVPGDFFAEELRLAEKFYDHYKSTSWLLYSKENHIQ